MTETLPPSFLRARYISSIGEQLAILNKYDAYYSNASKLQGDALIFLDTNFLLRIYKMSSVAREKVYQFFNEAASRIVISGQVEIEYLRNRESNIRAYEKAVATDLKTNFESLQITLKNYQQSNKELLNDFQDANKLLAEFTAKGVEVKASLDKISTEKKDLHQSVLYKDELMYKLQGVTLLGPMPNERLKEVKAEYQICLKDNKDQNITKFPGLAFPGVSDEKDKDDPTGDYVIYHEMMDYALAQGKDIIFLTHDVTKGDWMREDDGPHIHYIENFFHNTKQLLFILDAQRAIKDLYKVSTESVIAEHPADIQSVTDVIHLDFYDASAPVKAYNYNPQYLQSMLNKLIQAFNSFGSLRLYLRTTIEDTVKTKFLEILQSYKLIDLNLQLKYINRLYYIINTANWEPEVQLLLDKDVESV